jgi:hypothetical protein
LSSDQVEDSKHKTEKYPIKARSEVRVEGKISMVDVASIASFATGLKAAGDITRSLLGLKITSEVQTKVIELQAIIFTVQSDALTAQQAQFQLLTKLRALEEEIARLKSMGTERERYRMQQVATGAFAYTLKLETYAGEEPHWLCVTCFDSGHKSVLQNQGRSKDNQFSTYACSRCKMNMTVHWRAHPEAPTVAAAAPTPTAPSPTMRTSKIIRT